MNEQAQIVVNQLMNVTGRELRPEEIRLIQSLYVQPGGLDTFQSLLRDVVSNGVLNFDRRFGYGFFDD
ncbi:hypothetical protein [Paenibacillus sp. RC84]|uniref:hypothetical protein n=1 Tax=Paenibacillus sp. RC84 TaxID=3156252 RepID=UPI003517606C